MTSEDNKDSRLSLEAVCVCANNERSRASVCPQNAIASPSAATACQSDANDGMAAASTPKRASFRAYSAASSASWRQILSVSLMAVSSLVLVTVVEVCVGPPLRLSSGGGGPWKY